MPAIIASARRLLARRQRGYLRRVMSRPRASAARPAVVLLYGALCHGLFVLGVGTMAAMMYFGMSRSLGTLRAPWSLIANAALIAQFPLLHSFLLTKKGRVVLARVAPVGTGATLAPTTYVMIASAQILALFALWSPSEVIWWQAEGAALVVITALYALAWLLLGKAMADAGLALQTGALGWWALLRNKKVVYPSMPNRGLFRLSRQPIYLAFALTVWTVPTWTPDQLVVAVTFTVYCVVGPRFKEARFRRIYGAAFDAYAARVPYWLPWPRPTRLHAMRNDLSIYDTYAPHWWDGSQRFLRLLHNLVPARLAHFDTIVGSWRGKTVVDLGCGGGFMAEALARRGATVIGVDPCEAAIASASAHAHAHALSIDYRVGETIPVPDASVDCVVCVDVLEHVADLERVLDEIARVLKPRAVFLFDTINRTPLASLVLVHLGESVLGPLPRGTHDPAKFIKPAELSAMLAERGFEVGPLVGLGPRGLDRRLDFTFGRLPSVQIMYMGHAVAR
ncbi:MAG: bifunctional 2-polyprenyl-6-hydroxyphenol methylase/3-demethylubiquinol 3-O-methyltransferase UbiG [Enhygromyxa sp.]